MRKSGWDRTSPRPCGFTPEPYYATGATGTLGLATDTRNRRKCKLGDSVGSRMDHGDKKSPYLILETLHYDIDVPCPLQWALLWFSALTNFNRKFVNKGTKVAVDSAIEFTCDSAFDGTHTPRACCSRAVTIFLCYAPDRDWDFEEEMQGWGVREDRLARLSLYVHVGRAMKRWTCNE